MDEQPATIFEGQRQLREKFALGGIELRPRPVDRLSRNRVHATGATGDGSVMVAEQGHRAAFDLAHHRVDRKAGVGAVADVVAEKDETIDAAAACVVEACLERFAVGVNVAEQSNPHDFTSARCRPEFGNVSLSLTAVNGVDLPQRRASGAFGPIS